MRIIAALRQTETGETLMLSRTLTLHALTGQTVIPQGRLELLSREEQRALGVMTPAGDIQALSDVNVQLSEVGLSYPEIEGRAAAHVAYHSPTGMSHGYSGSGPADLALSILDWTLPPIVAHDFAADLEELEEQSLEAPDVLKPIIERYLSDLRGQLPRQPILARPHIIASAFALKWHQAFKVEFIAPQTSNQPFSLPGETICRWINTRLNPEREHIHH